MEVVCCGPGGDFVDVWLKDSCCCVDVVVSGCDGDIVCVNLKFDVGRGRLWYVGDVDVEKCG